MKSVYYVATVVNAYRMALDAYRDRPFTEPPDAALMEELEKASHRPYTTGFAFGDPGGEGQMTHSAGYIQTHELSAVVLEYDEVQHTALIEQRNRFFTGDMLEILAPGSIDRTITVRSLRTEDGEEVASAPHPQQRLWIVADQPLQAGDMLRKKLPQT